MSDGYGKHTSGFGITREQSIDLIVQACLDIDIPDTRQIAYVLATAQHESGHFRSLEEDWGRTQAVTIAHPGGEAYYRRDYAHLPDRQTAVEGKRGSERLYIGGSGGLNKK